jgi:dTDP-glucose 4,6-dehydratase
MLVLAWARTFKVPYIIVRPTNNYGTGQYVEKLIPKTCKLIQLGKKIPLHNNGTPTRVWLHAKDTARAITTIIDHEVQNEIYTIGGTCEYSNIEVVRKIIGIINGGNKTFDPNDYCDFSYHRDGQDIRYSLNDDKIRLLGWDNKCDMDVELPSIVKYYKENFIW